MAGAGFKTFNTGDVLTASDVNTYLMQQTVMVFASAAARTTALGANAAQGMLSYLKDTNVTQYYDGATWQTLSTGGDITDVNAGAGILVTNPTGPAPTVAFDQANYGGGQNAAGKNKIINGDFGIWQRGTSSASNGYQTADRWYCVTSGTTTWSQDTSVPTGIVNQYSLKYTTGASSSYGQLYQALESAVIKPLRGQSVVFSIYLKTTGTAFTGNLQLQAYYSNASDAYASQTTGVTITGGQSITPSGTWTRYSGTLTIPADAVGLKIGVVPTQVQASGVVVYHAAAQLEIGSTATPFQTATGTIQGELAACQRYYWRQTNPAGSTSLSPTGFATSTTVADIVFTAPVTMRVPATSIDYSNLRVWDGTTATTVASATLQQSDESFPGGLFTVASGLTANRPYRLLPALASVGYIGFNAEL